jgi:CRISPR associated protein Cas1
VLMKVPAESGRFQSTGPDLGPQRLTPNGPGREGPLRTRSSITFTRSQTEATIAAQRMGFDPTLGLMHTDKRYRHSLSSDLMEPVRAVTDPTPSSY